MRRFVLILALSAAALAAKTAVGPARGSLVVCGGGRLGPEVLNEFIALAGGADAPIVYIPTASDANEFPAGYMQKSALFRAGARNLTLLYDDAGRVLEPAALFRMPT